jgi:hypothetical protein
MSLTDAQIDAIVASEVTTFLATMRTQGGTLGDVKIGAQRFMTKVQQILDGRSA